MAYKVRRSFASYFLIATAFGFSAQSCDPANPRVAPVKTENTKPDVEAPKGEVASFKVQIDVHEGKCVLKYDGPLRGQMETELNAPCEFARDYDTGMIRHYEYKNKAGGVYSVILMIGGPVVPRRTDKFMKSGCGSANRPISLSPRGLALGLTGGAGLALCPSDPDEIRFAFGKEPV